jgi:hypothetical protein
VRHGTDRCRTSCRTFAIDLPARGANISCILRSVRRTSGVERRAAGRECREVAHLRDSEFNGDTFTYRSSASMTRLFRLEVGSRFLREMIAPLVFSATLSGCAGGAEYRQRTVASPPITAWVTHPVDLDRSGRYTTTSAQTASRVLPSSWGIETDWIQPREGAGGRSASLDTLHVLELAADGPLARVMSGALTDRSVVVAEASTGKLHFYDRTTGRMQRSVGRLGSGPGEFRRLDWLKARGAELYAYDAELRRLSVWTADGMLLRTVALAGETGATVPHPIDVFADGGILGASIVPRMVYRPTASCDHAPRP